MPKKNASIEQVGNGFIVAIESVDTAEREVFVYERESAGAMIEEVCKILGIHDDVYLDRPQTEEERRQSKTLTEDSV